MRSTVEDLGAKQSVGELETFTIIRPVPRGVGTSSHEQRVLLTTDH